MRKEAASRVARCEWRKKIATGIACKGTKRYAIQMQGFSYKEALVYLRSEEEVPHEYPVTS